MNVASGFCLTVLAALVGGLLLTHFKLPAGAMIGSMLGVALLNIATGCAWMPPPSRIAAQMLAGCVVGVSVNRKMLRSLLELIKPAAVLIVSIVAAGLGIGLTVYRVSDFNLTTALFSSAPGGMTDLTLISLDMGADPSKIVVMHLVRLICVICICPQMIKAISSRYDKTINNTEAEIVGTPARDTVATEPKLSVLELTGKNLLTIAVAVAGGLIGLGTGIPAGVILIAIVAVSVFSVITGKAYMSKNLRRAAQFVAGAIVGKDIGMEQVLSLRTMLLPAVMLVVLYIISNLLIAFLLHHACGMSVTNALFASMPAGASDMAFIAADIRGANAPQVTLLQVARLVSVIASYPFIVSALTK